MNSVAVGATAFSPSLMNLPISPRPKPARALAITGRVTKATSGLIRRSRISVTMRNIRPKPRAVIMSISPVLLLLETG